MQRIMLLGYVGNTPEDRVTSGGMKMTSFNLAVNAKSKGETVTTWYSIYCFNGDHKNMLSYIKKGSGLIISGELFPPTTYQSKQGETRISLGVKAEGISFLPAKKEEKDEASVFADKGGLPF